MANPILKDYETFNHKDIQYYDFDEYDIDKLVDIYFNDLSTKRKGFVGYFKWLGIKPYGTTYRGSFEYEEQYINYVLKSINKRRKAQRIIKRYYFKNLLEGEDNE